VTTPSDPGSGGEEGGGHRGPLHGEPTRLHPAVVGVWLGRSLFSLAIFVVLAGLVPVLGLAVFGGLVLFQAVRYHRFRWRVDGNAVVIEEGIFLRSRRVIPLDRVQAVDLEQGPVHRLLGVVELRIEAVGGRESQGRMAALGPEVAEELRGFLLDRRRVSGLGTEEGDSTSSLTSTIVLPEGEAGEVRWSRVSSGELVLAGLTGGRVGVMAAVVGFITQVVPDEWWPFLFGEAVGRAPDFTTGEGLRLVLLIVALVLLVAFLLSVGATVSAHWRFTLSGSDDALVVRRGLFTRHRDTLPFHRIQAIRIEENLFRRVLGLGAIRALTAGRAGSGEEGGNNVLLPLGRRKEVHRLALRAAAAAVEGVVGKEAPASVPEGEGEIVRLREGGAALFPALRPMPHQARRRRVVRAFAVAFLAAPVTGSAILLREWGWPEVATTMGLTFLSVFLVGWMVAAGAYRSLGWSDCHSYLVVREGVFNRRTTLVPTDRLQAVETRANPFQRAGGLATLHLWVAQPGVGLPPRAVDLPGETAAAWREVLGTRLHRW
jgi:putative membrane protein